jgi:predicted MFS family arabinose efflux permease
VIPNERLGRVGASYRFLVFLGMPFGALIGGMLANQFGVREAIFVSGSALVFLAVIIPVLLRRTDRYDG